MGLLMNAEPPPMDPNKGFTQVRPKPGETPAWYSPQRDLVNNFPAWIMASLKRFEKFPQEDEDDEKTMKAIGACSARWGRMLTRICNGDFAGKKDELESEIRSIQNEDPIAFASVSSMFATYLWWKFWQFAGETSLRKDISDD